MSRFTTTILVLGALVAPVAALAEPSPAREALKRFCTSDYMEHCSEHPPGGPEVEACFRANLKKLSPGCAGAITAFKRERKTTRQITEAH